MIRKELVGAVARGWCHPDTEHLVMDEKLAYAIVDEVEKIDNTPNLGCATTMELVDELKTRIEMNGTSSYRTIDAN
jgi:hypothetical protein